MTAAFIEGDKGPSYRRIRYSLLIEERVQDRKVWGLVDEDLMKTLQPI